MKKVLERSFVATLRETIVDDCSGYFFADLVDDLTGEVLRTSEVFDSLHYALSEFADLQAAWYEELGCCSTTDRWQVIVNVTI